LSDIQEANKAIEHILHSANELPLLFETVRVLSTRGDHNLFLIGVKKVLPLLSTQEELIDLMVLVADYYRCLDEEELEMAMQERIDKRQSIEGPLDPADSDLKALEKL